jgi:hypothetical protein
MIESLSQSAMNMWDRCGEQFRRRYIDDEIVPPGIAARIGTGVHKGAEVNHKAKRTTRTDEPLSVVQDAARDGYVQACQQGVFFAPDEVAGAMKTLAAGVDITTNLAKLYHKSLAPKIQPAIVEERLTLEVEGLWLPFSGIVDVYTEDDWLPDLKTADKKWANGRADTETQATIYNELVAERIGHYPSKISFEVFTKSKMEHHSFETTREHGDWLILVEKAKLMLKSIQAGIFPPAQPGSWICSPAWCGWFFSCPYISVRLKNTKGKTSHEF